MLKIGRDKHMNKKYILTILSAMLLTGCSSNTTATTSTPSITTTPTIESTANEVEAGKITLKTKDLDLSGYYLLDDEDPSFAQITFEESLRLFEEGGTGIIFYSYPDCPYCNRAIPVLNEAAKEKGMTVFYVYIYENEMVIDKTEEEWNETLDRFYEDAGSTLPQEINAETGEEEPVFYVPLVIAVKDGKITGSHCRLVSGFDVTSEDDQETTLTESQHDELLKTYEEVLESIQ